MNRSSIEEEPLEHSLKRIVVDLEHDIPLVLAKAIPKLHNLGVTKEVLRKAALFGVWNRVAG